MTFEDTEIGDIVSVNRADVSINPSGMWGDSESVRFLILSKDRFTDVDGNDVKPDEIGVWQTYWICGGLKGCAAATLIGMRHIECQKVGEIKL